MNRLAKNLGYQTVYQVLNTCLPLITAPYLSRVLGAEMQGVFSYTQSIVNYFTLIAMLGFTSYGTRSIASCSNKEDLSKTFWNIYLFQIVLSLASIIIYYCNIFFLSKSHTVIYAIQGLYLLGCLIDINWLFFGVEQFKTTVTRSIIIRVLSVILIIIFVKTPQDLWIYTLIMSGSPVASNAILWGFTPKYVCLNVFKFFNIKTMVSHIKPNILLFVPVLGMSLYHILDKTMLGFLSTYTQVGYYYNADKVINIPMGVLSGIGTVMLPRITALLSDGHEKKAETVFTISLECIIVLSCAMAFGIAAISKEFTPLFFGKGFEPCIVLIIILSPALIIKGVSETFRMQYLIPNHKEKIFIQSVFMGAAINVLVNIPLIMHLQAIGAVIGTLIAELVACVWQYYKIQKETGIAKIFRQVISYFLLGIVMFISVRLIPLFISSVVFSLLLEVAVGIAVYGVLCFIYWSLSSNSSIKSVFKKGLRHERF